MRLIVPPLPAASRPSKMIAPPVARILDPLLQFNQFDLELPQSGFVCLCTEPGRCDFGTLRHFSVLLLFYLHFCDWLPWVLGVTRIGLVVKSGPVGIELGRPGIDAVLDLGAQPGLAASAASRDRPHQAAGAASGSSLSIWLWAMRRAVLKMPSSSSSNSTSRTYRPMAPSALLIRSNRVRLM